MPGTVETAGNIAPAILQQADRYEDTHPHKNLALALADLVGQIDTTTAHGIAALLKDRPLLTPDHITPMLYAAAQYADTIAGVSHNFGTFTKDEWLDYVKGLFETNNPEIMKILRERNVQSFILRRYFPAKLLARMIFGDKAISILDAGCSLNLGMQAMSADKRGEVFEGLTLEEIPRELYSGPVAISNGLGIDLHEPDIDWVTSCIWPDHEREKQTIRDAHLKLNGKNPKIRFEKISALELDMHPELAGQFDLIIASGMLYQLSVLEEARFLQQVKLVGKPNAWFLSTDYPRDVSYKSPFGYLTFAHQIAEGILKDPLEFVKADNPFTSIIKPGKDFQGLI